MVSPDNPQIDPRREREFQDRQNLLFYQRPSLMHIGSYIETGTLPEKGEILKNYHRSGIDLMGPLRDLQTNERIRFVPNEYTLIRLDELAEGQTRDVQNSGIESGSTGEMTPEIAALTKLICNDLARTTAFTKIEKHSWGFKKNYFDNKNQQATLVTGRLSAAAVDDFKDAYGELDGLTLGQQEREILAGEKFGLPENEYMGEQVRQMTVAMEHFERSIAAMDRFNPKKPEGQEMPYIVTQTEQDLLAYVFKIELKPRGLNESDEEWLKRSDPNNANFKPKHTIQIEENGKRFYTNLLSYYMTVDTVKDRRRYESSMKALMETDALNRLKDLPRSIDQMNNEQSSQYTNLVREIIKARDENISNWNSPIKSVRARLSDYAFEQGNTAQTASLNIEEVTKRRVWSKKNGEWGYVMEIPGPETGQDAINGTNPFMHELMYKQKFRGVTSNMPYADVTRVEDAIKIVMGEEENNPLETKRKILADKSLALGAAILDLYPNEAMAALDKDDQEKVKAIRGDLKFNEAGLRVLRNLVWEFPIAVGKDRMIPMLIKPTLGSQNLWKILKDQETGETVHETLQGEYKTLSDVNWENMIWHQADAWEVNMKMLNDVLTTIYGRQDPRVSENFFSDPSSGLGEMIKKLDIGGRAEKWEMWVPREDGSGQMEKIKVPRGMIEITYAAYIIVTHLAMVDHGIWNGTNWVGVDKSSFWFGEGSSSKGTPGLSDWIQAALYAPETKASYGFNDYRGSLVLVLRALGEWYAGPAPVAQEDYTKIKGMRERVNQVIRGTKR